jgi:hypothetical protein
MVTAFEFPIVPGIRFVVRERIDAAAAGLVTDSCLLETDLQAIQERVAARWNCATGAPEAGR